MRAVLLAAVALAVAVSAQVSPGELLKAADAIRERGTVAAAREALPRYEEVLAAARTAGDRRVEALALNNVGLVHLTLGDRPKALGLLEQALALHRTAGNTRGMATTLTNLADVENQLGNKPKAIAYLTEALPLREQIGEPREHARTLTQFGAVYYSLDDIPKALDYFTRALPLWRAAGDAIGEGATVHNLASAYEARREFQRAIDAYHQAIALHRAAKYRAGEGNTLNNLARLYQSLGEYDRALAVFRQSLDIHRAVGNKVGEATTLTNIGSIYSSLGDLDRALDHFNEALPLRRAASDRAGEALTLTNVGRVYVARRQFQDAIDLYTRVLELHRAVGSRRGEALALTYLGAAEAGVGKVEAAIARFDAAARIQREIRDERGEAATLFARARTEAAVDRLDAAREHLAAAERIAESLRGAAPGLDLRMSYFASVQDYFELDVELLMRMHAREPGGRWAAQALHAVERARARGLLEMLADSRIETRTADATEAPAAAALDAEAIQHRLLDRDTLLLEYQLGETRSFLFAVTPSSIDTYELPSRAAIEDAVRAYHRAARTADGGAAAHDASLALARMLLDPAAPRIAGSRRLAIVASGALQIVPFAALPAPAVKGRTAAGPQTRATTAAIIDDHEVVALPSASALEALRREVPRRAAADRTLLVFADPVFRPDDVRVKTNGATESTAASRSLDDLTEATDPSRLSRLIGSRRESAAIASLLPPASVDRLLDFSANRSAALDAGISRYRVLHFATHAFVDTAQPQMSGIVLSMVDRHGAAQDGFVRLRDIFTLRLNADLVVLSACQTALGKDVRGEGVLGLARGFMHAGVPRVVATTWKVDDAAAAELMKRFYGGMFGAKKLTPAAALREAQLALRRQPRFSAPYYWAPFVLQGEWR
jgi:tetratricopeptide (TPR) repeat protein